MAAIQLLNTCHRNGRTSFRHKAERTYNYSHRPTRPSLPEDPCRSCGCIENEPTLTSKLVTIENYQRDVVSTVTGRLPQEPADLLNEGGNCSVQWQPRRRSVQLCWAAFGARRQQRRPAPTEDSQIPREIHRLVPGRARRVDGGSAAVGGLWRCQGWAGHHKGNRTRVTGGSDTGPRRHTTCRSSNNSCHPCRSGWRECRWPQRAQMARSNCSKTRDAEMAPGNWDRWLTCLDPACQSLTSVLREGGSCLWKRLRRDQSSGAVGFLLWIETARDWRCQAVAGWDCRTVSRV